jgi:hypothetical protein
MLLAAGMARIKAPSVQLWILGDEVYCQDAE